MKEYRKIDKNTLLEYQNYINSVRKVDSRDTATLSKLYKEAVGEEKIRLRNKIVENNLPLVIAFLKTRYSYSYDVNPVFDMEDIIEEANLLLINAVDRYDPSKGNFSVFLYKVLNKIYYINGIPNSPVNFNYGRSGAYKKVKKAIDLGYDDEFIMSNYNISAAVMHHIRPLLTDTVSYDELLEQLIAKENDENASNLIYEDENLERVLEAENIDIRNEAILQALNKLTARQRQFIISKFELDGNGERKSRDIIKEVGGHERYLYELNKRTKARLLKNEILRQVYDLVDIDHDYEKTPKTYYLQK